MALIKSYFSIMDDYKTKYGSDTLLLMQVGSFYEVYSYKETDEHMTFFSKICDLKIAGKHDIFMAGFRDYMIDKYIQKLNDTTYTTVVFNQEEIDGVIHRKESVIYSPGTTFIEDDLQLSNNISCIWVHTTKKNIIFGISNIDIYTGKTNIYEYQTEYYHNPSTYDNIENFVSIYNPNEIIIIYKMDEPVIDNMINYINSKSKKITRINLTTETTLAKQALCCEGQHYQNEIILKFYALNKKTFLDNLFEKTVSFQSFCFLLNYVFEHNPSLTHKLCEPLIDNQTNNLLLANHSLKQLNIIDGHEYNNKYSSLIKLLNTCRTSVGKRSMSYLLLNPTKQISILQESYDMIEHGLSVHFKCSHELSQIKDVEKIFRKIIHKKASPCDYYFLHEACEIILNINLSKEIKKHIEYEETYTEISIIKQQINQFFNLSICKQINSIQLDKFEVEVTELINKGINPDLDYALQCKLESKEQINSIIVYLNNLYCSIDKKCKDAIKTHETGALTYLLITKKRGMSLKKYLDKDIELEYTDYNKKKEKFMFKTSLLKYEEYNGTTSYVTSEQINNYFKVLNNTNDIFNTKLYETYNKINDTMSSCHYTKLVETIRKLDVLNTKCELALLYKYSKPIIEKNNNSFIKIKKLRHALIEHLEKNEIYVTNDIELGNNPQGILLFGTNAVGKTSLIKSIGICVIMAQAGLYVPCESMIYCPYEYIFTRIIGNDNIFKGLSTFGVEMSELRVILNKCNKNSLILGDELCSGTEIDSALSIFTTGLETMYKNNSSFIFATHFHQIQYFDEIKNMNNLALKHLKVQYNNETQQLIYDRKLMDGAGESIYGLEVCKSLHLPSNFLTRAYEIRNKYSNICNSKSILSLKTTTHNKEKIRGICEFCKINVGTEIHHLRYQKESDITGHIEHFHKDHIANLASICETCHDRIHSLGLVYEKKQTLDGESIILKK